MNADESGIICPKECTNRELDFFMSTRKQGEEIGLTAHQRKDMDVNLVPGK